MTARRVAFSLLLALSTLACEDPDECVCEGTVPEGQLSVACGESQCIAGAGYRCTGANTAVAFPAACDSAADVDAGGAPGDADAPKPDAGAAPLGDSCDPLTAGSCPEGQRCGLSREDGQPRCFYASASDRQRGGSCTIAGDGDDCADGLTCVQDPSAGSICAKLCSATDYSGCSRAETCNVPIDDTFSACSASCDLVTSDGCPAGAACGVFVDESGAVFKGCNVAGSGTHKDDCSPSSACAPGHVCAYWSRPPYLSGFECLQLCDMRGVDGAACPEGTECSSPPRELEPFAAVDGVGACR